MDVQQDGEDTASHAVISRCLSVSRLQEVEQCDARYGSRTSVRHTWSSGFFAPAHVVLPIGPRSVEVNGNARTTLRFESFGSCSLAPLGRSTMSGAESGDRAAVAAVRTVGARGSEGCRENIKMDGM